MSDICHSEAHILEAPGARWHPCSRCESLALFFGRHLWLACMRPFQEAAAALPAMCAPFWSSRDEQRMEIIHAERGERVLRSLVWAGCRSSCLQCRNSPQMGHGPAFFRDAPPGRCVGHWEKPRNCGLGIFLVGSDPSAEHPALSCGELSVICHGHGKAAVADVIPCIVWPCLDTVPAACYLQWCRHKLAENGRRCS